MYTYKDVFIIWKYSEINYINAKINKKYNLYMLDLSITHLAIILTKQLAFHFGQPKLNVLRSSIKLLLSGGLLQFTALQFGGLN